MPWLKGKLFSATHKAKIVASLNQNPPFGGHHHTDTTKQKLREKRKYQLPTFKGCHHTDATKAKIRKALLGRPNPHQGIIPSEDTRLKMSRSFRGDNNPAKRPDVRVKISKAMTGRIMTPAHRAALSEAHLGKKLSLEQREKIGMSQRGENHWNWQGGLAEVPYCEKWTPEFRERVRAFWSHKCGLCEKPQSENITRTGKVKRLSVHHVHRNKDACCDDTIPWHFIPLCIRCHAKVGGKSKENHLKWEAELTAIIKTKFGGKCYFTKEEYSAITA